MEEIKFSGIKFRSYSHLSWFLLSLLAFLISWLWYMVTENSLPHYSRMLWLCFLLFHSGTAIGAIISVLTNCIKRLPVNGIIYSIDCIWFNGLLSIVYCLQMTLIK